MPRRLAVPSARGHLWLVASEPADDDKDRGTIWARFPGLDRALGDVVPFGCPVYEEAVRLAYEVSEQAGIDHVLKARRGGRDA